MENQNRGTLLSGRSNQVSQPTTKTTDLFFNCFFLLQNKLLFFTFFGTPDRRSSSPRFLTEGLSYSTLIYLTTVINKYGVGYLNPAVTFAIMVTNKSHGRYQWGTSHLTDWKRGCYLILAQFVGGTLGAVLVLATIPNSMKGEDVLGIPALNYGSTPSSAFVFETFGTFFLTWVILCNTCRNRSVISKNVTAPMAIGLATVSLNIFAFPFTGASFNPIRAFAPMLVSWSWAPTIFVYLIAPLIGGLLGMFVYVMAFTNFSMKFGCGYAADTKTD